MTDTSGTMWSGDFITNVGSATNTLCLGIGDDTSPLLSSSASVTCTGAGISGATYNFPVDGIFTEELTFFADNKSLGGGCGSVSEDTSSKAKTRQHYNGGAPSLVTSAGNLTNISISTSVSREQILALGNFKAVHNDASLPAEVTVEFEVSATSTDGCSVWYCSGL